MPQIRQALEIEPEPEAQRLDRCLITNEVDPINNCQVFRPPSDSNLVGLILFP